MSNLKQEKPFFHKGHMCYNVKNNNNKYEVVRADKLVYVSFVDNTLDPLDNSWDLTHLDGDWKNCHVDNLKKINVL